VFVLLAAMHFVGISSGFHVWYYLHQPGKDPLVQLYQCGPIGLALAVLSYLICFKRAWRLSLPAAGVAFALGALPDLQPLQCTCVNLDGIDPRHLP
jgi:hypothetical protein